MQLNARQLKLVSQKWGVILVRKHLIFNVFQLTLDCDLLTGDRSISPSQ